MELLSWSIAFFRKATSSVVRLNLVGTGTGVTVIFDWVTFGVGITVGTVVSVAFDVIHPPIALDIMTRTISTTCGLTNLIVETVHY
jgi:hypothetical protein